MKHLVKIFSLGAALAASPLAHATTISIGLQQTGYNSGNIQTVATDSVINGAASFTGSFGTFVLNQISATGSPFVSQGNLMTNSIQTSASTSGTITIYITASGLTSPVGLTSFLSSFTSNTLSPGASVVESTLYSSGNALYAGTPMASTTFSSGGLNTASSTSTINLSGLYSETAVYVVTVGASGGTANDTINISAAATPEPSSLIMLGTGLMSAAGMMVRRRKIS